MGTTMKRLILVVIMFLLAGNAALDDEILLEQYNKKITELGRQQDVSRSPVL